MKKGGYKRYLDPSSEETIPRSTFYNKQKQQRLQSIEQQNSPTSSSSSSPSSSFSHIEDAEIENIEDEKIGGVRDLNNWCQLDLSFDNSDNDDLEIDTPDYWFDAEDSEHAPSPDSSTHNFCATDDDDHESNAHFREKLCECTSTTVGEAVMMALALGAKHLLTWETIIDILSLINTLFGVTKVPTTKYKLFKYFPFANDTVTYHLYCSKCQGHLEDVSNLNARTVQLCNHCDEAIGQTDLSFFLTLNFRSQLKQVLEDREVQTSILHRFQREKKHEDALEDIYDGRIYSKLSTDNQLLAYPYNFSYTFSTDGCQTSKSSRVSAWPIYAMIHELPPKLRTKHILMTGLWVSDIQPDMNIFMGKFTEQANLLSTEGVEWKLGERTIKSKVFPLCGCFDSVARCKVLNMKQYNGYYGCTFCEHPAESVNGNIRYPISTNVYPDRTDESVKDTMVLIGRNDYSEIHTKGVKGPSTLMNLNHFDLVNGMIPDYMHSILLGVIKQHTELLLTAVNTEYYIGNPANLHQINNRLLTIKHPSCITRSPRKLEERYIWKASEWRSWLIFYSLICLKGILKRRYLKHLALLVSAVETLLSDSITKEMIDKADSLLIRYVACYQEFFGKISMTYNVHLLLHVRKSVLNWGPLWTHNAFCFENENKNILQLKKSPAHIALQITKKYLFYKSLRLFVQKYPTGDNFKLFHERTLTEKLKNSLKIDSCVLIGNGTDYQLNDCERRLVDFPDHCKSFNRMIVNGVRFTSESYRKCLKLNDYVIETKCGKKGIITNICIFPNRVEENIVIFYRGILTAEPFLSTTTVHISHIQYCTISDNIRKCNPNSLLKLGFLISLNDEHIFVSIPKGCYGD